MMHLCTHFLSFISLCLKELGRAALRGVFLSDWTVTIPNIPTRANCRAQRRSQWLLCAAVTSETTRMLFCSRCCAWDKALMDRWGIHQSVEKTNKWGGEERGGEETGIDHLKQILWLEEQNSRGTLVLKFSGKSPDAIGQTKFKFTYSSSKRIKTAALHLIFAVRSALEHEIMFCFKQDRNQNQQAVKGCGDENKWHKWTTLGPFQTSETRAGQILYEEWMSV